MVRAIARVKVVKAPAMPRCLQDGKKCSESRILCSEIYSHFDHSVPNLTSLAGVGLRFFGCLCDTTTFHIWAQFSHCHWNIPRITQHRSTHADGGSRSPEVLDTGQGFGPGWVLVWDWTSQESDNFFVRLTILAKLFFDETFPHCNLIQIQFLNIYDENIYIKGSISPKTTKRQLKKQQKCLHITQ